VWPCVVPFGSSLSSREHHYVVSMEQPSTLPWRFGTKGGSWRSSSCSLTVTSSGPKRSRSFGHEVPTPSVGAVSQQFGSWVGSNAQSRPQPSAASAMASTEGTRKIATMGQRLYPTSGSLDRWSRISSTSLAFTSRSVALDIGVPTHRDHDVEAVTVDVGALRGDSGRDERQQHDGRLGGDERVGCSGCHV
jgi:hypothetical protein